MIKLTFDGTKFRDDQGREVVNPEEIMEGLAIIKTDGKIEWPYGYEIDDHCSEGDKCTGNDTTCEGHPVYVIKLIHPSERANDRHEKSKQLFKEFLNSEEAKEIIGTMKDEKLTPEQGSELVEIYKKAGWYADEANKECPYCAPDGTIWRDGSMICPHCKGSHFIVEEANKNDMKDFKKFTMLEEPPTTATDSTEAKPEPTKEEPYAWYFKKHCEQGNLKDSDEITFKLGFSDGNWHGYKDALKSQPSTSEEPREVVKWLEKQLAVSESRVKELEAENQLMKDELMKQSGQVKSWFGDSVRAIIGLPPGGRGLK